MTNWRNRIVRSGTADPKTLMANPENHRLHGNLQQSAMVEVLDTVGWVQDVILQEGTDLIIDGHMRVGLALRKGELVPATWVDLTSDEVRQVLATYDAISSEADVDSERFTKLLDSLGSASPVISSMLSNVAERHHLIPKITPGQMNTPAPETPKLPAHKCPTCGRPMRQDETND